MTDAERQKAFKDAQKAILKKRTAIQVDTRAEIVRLLKVAQDQIKVVLASQPSDYQLWSLSNLSKEISRVLAEFGEQGAAVIGTAAGESWQAGLDIMDKPLAAAQVTLALPHIDTRQLMAMRTFMTDRIKDIGIQAANKINSQLGLVVIGAQSPGDAIGQVSTILGEQSRARATTIVRTELGRVFAVANNKRINDAGKHLPGLKKQWRRSGKIHSRQRHDMTDGQVQPVNKPFVIGRKLADPDKDGGIKMMYPHDPAAPAAETINCGCISLPYMDSWQVITPGAKPYSQEEINKSPAKRVMAQAEKSPSLSSLIQQKAIAQADNGTILPSYDLAKAGGAYNKFYDVNASLRLSSLERASRSYGKVISQHEAWLENPESKKWEPGTSQQDKDYCVQKKWPRDLKRNRTYLEIIDGIIKEKKNAKKPT